jgi:hypothetical protein
VVHATNARRDAAARIFSPGIVNLDLRMNPMRVSVRSAIGLQKSVETPSANHHRMLPVRIQIIPRNTVHRAPRLRYGSPRAMIELKR